MSRLSRLRLRRLFCSRVLIIRLCVSRSLSMVEVFAVVGAVC